MERDENVDREKGGLTGKTFEEMTRMEFGHCCNTFQKLRHVDLEVTSDEEEEDGWKTGYSAQILSCAGELEKLSITGWMAYPFPAQYLLGDSTWSRLSVLSVTYAIFTEGELSSVLRRHAASLKELELWSVDLEEGTWSTILTKMKRWLSLNAVTLWGLSEQDDDGSYIDRDLIMHEAREYLMGSGPHPLLEE